MPEKVNLTEDGTVPKGQLQRFLKLIGFSFDEIKGLINAFPSLLDPDRTDADYLPLLGALIGLDIDRNVSIPYQREQIKYEVELYKKKGSIPAIKQFGRNIFGMDSQIYEYPRNIMITNDPVRILPVIAAGSLENIGLPGDPLYYILDFSESGDYRFDKFGIYFQLLDFLEIGIPRSAIEKILRLTRDNIPASTAARIIFVDSIYQLTTSADFTLQEFYHAFGGGDKSWDISLPGNRSRGIRNMLNYCDIHV